MPVCEIVTVGTEILLGDVVDTNAARIARALAAAGLDVLRKTTVGDNPERIRDAIATGLGRSDAVLVTGGLGPTVDDVTREALAMALGRPLSFRPELWDEIARTMRSFGREPAEGNKRQAYVPDGARPIPNPVGTAPGIYAEADGGVVVAVPGVPSEMRHLLFESVLPLLSARFGPQGTILVRVVHTAGAGESEIDARIADLETGANPTVGLAARPGQVDVRIVAKARTREDAEAAIAPVEAEVRRRLGGWVFGVDGDTLPGAVLELAARRGWCLVAVEAGLHGELVAPLAAVPGPFRRGEVLPPPMGPLDLRGILLALLTAHAADIGLAVSLHAAADRQALLARVLVVGPGGIEEDERPFGGHPDLAPARAANAGLDLLRRTLLEAGAD